MILVNISLKKLFAKKELSSLLHRLTLKNPVNIFDINGNLLMGDISQHFDCDYPIRIENRLIGRVNGTEKAIVIAELLTYVATQELEKKTLAQETLDKYEQINYHYEISSKISSCLGVQEITQLLINEVKKLIQATEVSVMLLNEETKELENVLVCSPEQREKTGLKAGIGIAGYVLVTGKPEIVNHIQLDSRYLQKDKEIYSLICAPLTIQKKTIGIITISNSEKNDYTAEDLKILTAITNQAAGSIQTAQYCEILKQYSHDLEIKVAERTITLEKANQELKRIANLDGLTEVANRRRFDEYLSEQWLMMGLANLPLSLILCDIDYFKLYNDYYGHQQGDDCLKKISQTINKIPKRSSDLVARYGGEELAVIMPNTNIAGALRIAEEIKIKIQELRISHQGSKIDEKFITISMGISSILPSQENHPEMLISFADIALYQAKNMGRNRYCVKF